MEEACVVRSRLSVQEIKKACYMQIMCEYNLYESSDL